jgi:hypothetical protein
LTALRAAPMTAAGFLSERRTEGATPGGHDRQQREP